MQPAQLPHLDEHATTVAADVGDVWLALSETLDRTFSQPRSAGYARAVGCTERVASGPRPLAVGSTVPGFRVAGATPGSELVLQGRHRFSTYALIFRLEQLAAGRSRLRAETRAEFPGLAGRVYRLLLLRTGGHVLGTRRLLAAVASRSETRAGTGDQ
jgi:hypothetical protein